MLNINGYKMIFFLENLLRNYIEEFMSKDDVNTKVVQIATELALENGISAPVNFNQLLKYLHLGQLVDIIKAHSSKKKNTLSSVNIQVLIRQRNNVMHSRIISHEDYEIIESKCKEVIISLSENGYLTKWNQFINVDIDEFEIPLVYIEYPVGKSFEKLIGRESELRSLKDELKLHTPVSVIGSGGLGKTALVLQLIEDLIYSPTQEFDRIYFMSFKNSVFENGEIKRFEKNIGNHQDLINKLATLVYIPTNELSFQQIENMVWEDMFAKKSLLILDNLETEIVQSNLAEFSDIAHKFIRYSNSGSRLLITSRYGLGERENPFPLNQFEITETRKLMTTYMKDQSNRLDNLDAADWEWIQKFTQGNPGLIISLCYTLRSSLKPIKEIRIEYETETQYTFENTDLNTLLEEFLRFCFENTIENMPKESQYFLASLCYICAKTNIFQVNEELLSFLREELKFTQKFGERNLRAQVLVNIGFLQKHRNSSYYTVNELIVDYIDGNYSDTEVINVFRLRETEYFRDVKRVADLINEIKFDKELSLSEVLAELYTINFRNTSDVRYMSRAFQCNPKIDILIKFFKKVNTDEIIKNFPLIDRLSGREVNDPRYFSKQQQLICIIITALSAKKKSLLKHKSGAINTNDLFALFLRLEAKFKVLKEKLIDIQTRRTVCGYLIGSRKLDLAEEYLTEEPGMKRIKIDIYVNQIGNLAGSNRVRCEQYIEKLKHTDWSKSNIQSIYKKFLIFCARFYRQSNMELCISFINRFNAQFESIPSQDDLSNYNFYLEAMLQKAFCLANLKRSPDDVKKLVQDFKEQKGTITYKKLLLDKRNKFERELEGIERLISQATTIRS
ncbi:hypothetical protein [Paenibacillus hubeiensis]|uniref:hypothetical protein n=1 Tax=Paenibacillus hubeiensis TaxID=3077330 RepID=UPI0031BA1870